MNSKNNKVLYSKKANGKLLLTGEYFVLDGTESIAIPTKYGQSLIVKESTEFSWEAKDNQNKTWIKKNQLKDNNSDYLEQILNEISIKKNIPISCEFRTKLDFPNEWGLGSSSTLIYLVADYFQVNPFELNQKIFHGSGYDIACAFNDFPIIYSNKTDLLNPRIKPICLNDDITNKIFFIYLNQKQNSRSGIERYRTSKIEKSSIISELSEITNQMTENQNLEDWVYYIEKHEKIISKSLEIPKVKDLIFPDCEYTIKSLGAWGGDFIMVISDRETNEVKNYFRKKGFHTIFTYSELILQ